jgi:hypothetical protein
MQQGCRLSHAVGYGKQRRQRVFLAPTNKQHLQTIKLGISTEAPSVALSIDD